jgi:hypothetical protein
MSNISTLDVSASPETAETEEILAHENKSMISIKVAPEALVDSNLTQRTIRRKTPSQEISQPIDKKSSPDLLGMSNISILDVSASPETAGPEEILVHENKSITSIKVAPEALVDSNLTPRTMFKLNFNFEGFSFLNTASPDSRELGAKAGDELIFIESNGDGLFNTNISWVLCESLSTGQTGLVPEAYGEIK